MSCKKEATQENYAKSLLLGEGEYKEFNDDSLILKEGYLHDEKFTGKELA